MKKIVLIYCLVVYAFTFIITLLSLNKIKLEILSLCVISAIVLVGLYNLFKNKNVQISLCILVVINLFQSVNFIVSGMFYKFIVGLSFNFKFLLGEEVKTHLSFLLYDSDVKFDDYDSNEFAIGINIVQLLLFIYFMRWLIRIENQNNKV